MTAVVQQEQSTTMASMGGFGNKIIVSHPIHRSSLTGAESAFVQGTAVQLTAAGSRAGGTDPVGVYAAVRAWPEPADSPWWE